MTIEFDVPIRPIRFIETEDVLGNCEHCDEWTHKFINVPLNDGFGSRLILCVPCAEKIAELLKTEPEGLSR